MTRQTISTLFVAATVCAVLSFHGCTFAGLLVGAGIDRSMAERDTLTPTQFSAAKHGEDVEVILRSGKVVSGSFVTLDLLPATEYAKNYNTRRSGEGGESGLPMIGDSVTLLTVVGKANLPPTIGGEFVGFDPDVVVLRREGRSVAFRTHIFQTIRDGHGHIIDQDTFRRLVEEGLIPFMTAVVVETGNGKERSPMESVRQIERPLSRNNPLVFGGFGLGVDAAIALLLFTSRGLFR